MLYPIKDRSPDTPPSIPLILQARTRSTRYPNKILQPFGNDHSLLEFLLHRLKAAFPHNPIVVATSNLPADQPIANIAAANTVDCFRGSEQDVLLRFIECCRYYNFDHHIVRVCADNPFLQTELLQQLIEEWQTTTPDCDYASYRIGETPAIRTHFGFFAEIVAVKALEKANALTNNPLYHEHVTNFIYDNPTQSFLTHWIPLPQLQPYLETIRLTIDSKEDFDHASLVYNNLQTSDNLSWPNIVSLLNQYPFLKNQMTTLIRSYRK